MLGKLGTSSHWPWTTKQDRAWGQDKRRRKRLEKRQAEAVINLGMECWNCGIRWWEPVDPGDDGNAIVPCPGCGEENHT